MIGLTTEATRSGEVNMAGSGWWRPVAEETSSGGVDVAGNGWSVLVAQVTCEVGANMADSGSSLQSSDGCWKDEGDGCREVKRLTSVAVGSRLALTGPPFKRAPVRGELGQAG